MCFDMKCWISYHKSLLPYLYSLVGVCHTQKAYMHILHTFPKCCCKMLEKLTLVFQLDPLVRLIFLDGNVLDLRLKDQDIFVYMFA